MNPDRFKKFVNLLRYAAWASSVILLARDFIAQSRPPATYSDWGAFFCLIKGESSLANPSGNEPTILRGGVTQSVYADAEQAKRGHPIREIFGKAIRGLAQLASHLQPAAYGGEIEFPLSPRPKLMMQPDGIPDFRINSAQEWVQAVAAPAIRSQNPNLAQQALSQIRRQEKRPTWRELKANADRLHQAWIQVNGLEEVDRKLGQIGQRQQNIFQVNDAQKAPELWHQINFPKTGLITEDENLILKNLTQAGRSQNHHQRFVNEQQKPLLREEFATALPRSIYRDQSNNPKDVTELVLKGEIPSDKELAQLFHTLELEWLKAQTSLQRMQTERNESLLKHILAANMTGPNALKTKDGYIVIGNEAINRNEAYSEALSELTYFQIHRHHRPSRFPVIASEVSPTEHNITKYYNSIRQKVSKDIDILEEQIKGRNMAEKTFARLTYFSDNFKNNAKWDTQGQYGLPGQAVLRNPRTNELLYHTSGYDKGEIITKDQYAWYEGKPVRAGFLSNYIYGYTAAKTFGHPAIMHGAAQLVNLKDNFKHLNLKPDNPEDVLAYLQGWKDYLKEFDEQYYLERIRHNF